MRETKKSPVQCKPGDRGASERESLARCGHVHAGEAIGLERTFERALRAHIDKEDNSIFPAAAVGLDGADWLEVHDTTPQGLCTPEYAAQWNSEVKSIAQNLHSQIFYQRGEPAKEQAKGQVKGQAKPPSKGQPKKR